MVTLKNNEKIPPQNWTVLVHAEIEGGALSDIFISVDYLARYSEKNLVGRLNKMGLKRNLRETSTANTHITEQLYFKFIEIC
jgi:hypothetical protein